MPKEYDSNCWLYYVSRMPQLTSLCTVQAPPAPAPGHPSSPAAPASPASESWTPVWRQTAAAGSSWTLRRAAGPGWTAASSSWTGVWKASPPLQQLLARTTSSSTPQVSTQPLAVLAVLTWGYILRKYFHCNIFLHFTLMPLMCGDT